VREYYRGCARYCVHGCARGYVRDYVDAQVHCYASTNDAGSLFFLGREIWEDENGHRVLYIF
jgi:hypothetical protein